MAIARRRDNAVETWRRFGARKPEGAPRRAEARQPFLCFPEMLSALPASEPRACRSTAKPSPTGELVTGVETTRVGDRARYVFRVRVTPLSNQFAVILTQSHLATFVHRVHRRFGAGRGHAGA